MRAVVLDNGLRIVENYPLPAPPSGWALIKVMNAGICGTDLELAEGYKGFRGVLGHEFTGVVHESPSPEWINKKVVGEINVGCRECCWCRSGLGRHCPSRRVLGISNLGGCMADYCVLPEENLVELPPEVGEDKGVLIEPLSAACEILEQVPVGEQEKVIVLGDGPMGILCAWVLSTASQDVTLVGRHPEKLKKAQWRHINTILAPTQAHCRPADILVDATGSDRGIHEAISLLKPRGRLVLKTTLAGKSKLNLSDLVVKELTLVGSRCGRFKDALQLLAYHPDMPLRRLLTHCYPLDKALAAFEQAHQPDSLKVLLKVSGSSSREHSANKIHLQEPS